jgi:energy-converting hydrogenase A subunit M
MHTNQLTISLAKSKIDFLEKYAKKNNITVSELIDEYVKRLQFIENYSLHSDIEKNAGVIPKNVEPIDLYHGHLEEKHK